MNPESNPSRAPSPRPPGGRRAARWIWGALALWLLVAAAGTWRATEGGDWRRLAIAAGVAGGFLGGWAWLLWRTRLKANRP